MPEVMVDIHVETARLLREMMRSSFPVTITYLSELLHMDRDATIDWLVCKAAQFRGVSEETMLEEIEALNNS